MKGPRLASVARFSAAVASGALLAFSRPPFDIGPLACVALVPLFLAWRGRTVRGAAGLAFVAGIVYYGILCSWIWYFGAQDKSQINFTLLNAFTEPRSTRNHCGSTLETLAQRVAVDPSNAFLQT